MGSGDAGAPHILTGARELDALAGNFPPRVCPGQEHDFAPDLLAPVLTDVCKASARPGTSWWGRPAVCHR
ncbi:hypothetical protein ACIPW5_05835 [Streptomyces sp. NPDC090077]|uniref:hypothetical protein n=1 Tax=Streptomyces sp. NPDC090077 TaxID=3365938 RepID=UPI00380EE26C